jgi:hypothetical protein
MNNSQDIARVSATFVVDIFDRTESWNERHPHFLESSLEAGLPERSLPSVLKCPVLNPETQFLTVESEGHLSPNLTNITS